MKIEEEEHAILRKGGEKKEKRGPNSQKCQKNGGKRGRRQVSYGELCGGK